MAWGDNGAGETTIPNNLSGVVAVSAGYDFSLALLSNGTMVAWGDNSVGACTIPTGLSGIIAISASENESSVALKSDGSVVAWGYNEAGQTDVPNDLFGVTAISAGSDDTLVMVGLQSALAWGVNSIDGLSGFTSLPVKAVAAGGFAENAYLQPARWLIGKRKALNPSLRPKASQE